MNGKSAILYVWYDNEFGYSCQVHRVLEQMAGVHYAVEVEPYRGSGLLSSFFEYKGAMFYVRSDKAAFCREKLEAGGFGYGILSGEE